LLAIELVPALPQLALTCAGGAAVLPDVQLYLLPDALEALVLVERARRVELDGVLEEPVL
jgi:hypothetical protein